MGLPETTRWAPRSRGVPFEKWKGGYLFQCGNQPPDGFQAVVFMFLLTTGGWWENQELSFSLGLNRMLDLSNGTAVQDVRQGPGSSRLPPPWISFCMVNARDFKERHLGGDKSFRTWFYAPLTPQQFIDAHSETSLCVSGASRHSCFCCLGSFKAWKQNFCSSCSQELFFRSINAINSLLCIMSSQIKLYSPEPQCFPFVKWEPISNCLDRSKHFPPKGLLPPFVTGNFYWSTSLKILTIDTSIGLG